MLENFVISETYVAATVECMGQFCISEECGKLQHTIKVWNFKRFYFLGLNVLYPSELVTILTITLK